jgi:hypothetical protein
MATDHNVPTIEKSAKATLDLPQYLPLAIATAYTVAKQKLLNDLDLPHNTTEEAFRTTASPDLVRFIDDLEKFGGDAIDFFFHEG